MENRLGQNSCGWITDIANSMLHVDRSFAIILPTDTPDTYWNLVTDYGGEATFEAFIYTNYYFAPNSNGDPDHFTIFGLIKHLIMNMCN